MQQTSTVLAAIGRFVGKYGAWIILGLMALEITMARRRGEL